METQELFPASLISTEAAAAFPDSYTIRPLQRGDYAKGFLDCFQVLTAVGDVSEKQFQAQFDWMCEHGKGIHHTLVIEFEGRIVGTGAVIVERKLCVLVSYCFIHLYTLLNSLAQKDKTSQASNFKII